MLSEEHKEKLYNQYELLNSIESQLYTQKILLEMGKVIQQYFPGVEFELKARYKSPKSFQGKIERLIKDTEKDKYIYDNIGFCLIVKSVSDNFGFKHALCERFVKKRIKLGLEIDNEKSSLKILEVKYKKVVESLKNTEKLEKKIEELKKSDNPDEEVIKLLEESLNDKEKLKILAEMSKQQIQKKTEKIEEIANEYYNEIDNKINEMIAIHIMNKLMTNKNFMNSLKLEKIPGRTKNHDGGKSGYYIAFHDALKSRLLKYWMVDLHAMSYKNYVVSQLDHSQAEGKERIFPRIDSGDFKKNVLDAVPRNLVYQNGRYKDGKEIKAGKVYVCSDVENVTYFFTETLKDNSNIFKYVISDNELFSGKGKIIETNSGDVLEYYLLEEDMEK